jgi:hypothetical protein
MMKSLTPPDKWLPVSIAPTGVDLELCVMGRDGVHALVFPCRRTDAGWVDPATQKRLDIAPKHWRRWPDGG